MRKAKNSMDSELRPKYDLESLRVERSALSEKLSAA